MHNVDQFTAQAAAPKILLHLEITSILQRAGHSRPNAWLEGLHPDAQRPEIVADVQRFLINRYWHGQFGALPPETLDRHENMDIRYCLVPQGDLGRWLELFEEKIAPCIVKHNLPTP